MAKRSVRRLFSRLTPSTERNLADLLRNDRVGGILMLLGTVVALVWVNSRFGSAYVDVRDAVPLPDPIHLGPLELHLSLTVGDWAKDGLLAIFFFVIGLELKREIVNGELRRPATAIVPIVAAVGGMAMPALIYVVMNLQDGGALDGWAVPTATDIAFALAVLSVVGRRLPNALRAFLLTLAVVDDLLAILIIAIFYSHGFSLPWLLAAVAVIAVFGVLVQRRFTAWWVLIPLGVVAWLCMHESGIHATIAGVALGMVVPAARRRGEKHSVSENWEHRWSPISSGFAVPVFAFFAAGVALNGEALRAIAEDPASQGVALGLVLGKPLGILLFTALVARFTRASLDRGLSWWDVTAVAAVAGIGFTVSLLISELAFPFGEAEYVKAAVLIGSGTAAVAGAILLAWRDRHYGRIVASRQPRADDAVATSDAKVEEGAA